MSSAPNGPMTPQEIRKHLDQFDGTQAYHKHPFGLVMTDGVVEAAKIMGCWWLMDAIASYQMTKAVKGNARRRSFIVWRLVVNPDSSAVLGAYEDWDSDDHSAFKPFIKQKIQSTDFPLPEFTLWQERDVLLLPSEH